MFTLDFCKKYVLNVKKSKKINYYLRKKMEGNKEGNRETVSLGNRETGKQQFWKLGGNKETGKQLFPQLEGNRETGKHEFSSKFGTLLHGAKRNGIRGFF